MLGLVQVVVDDRPVPLTLSERTLLAGIASASGRVVTVSALSDWVWGGGHHASPRNRIQALVSAIRRKVAPADLIVTHEVGYQLDPSVGTDLRDRDELRRRLSEDGLTAAQRRALLHSAAALTTGQPLDGCHPTPEVDSLARRLGEEHLELLAERVEADLSTGQLDGLAAELSTLTKRHPFHETFHAQLMRVLARTGRQADALAVYRAAFRRLDDELGVRPGPALSAAHQDVLRAVHSAPDSAPSRGLPAEPPDASPPVGTRSAAPAEERVTDADAAPGAQAAVAVHHPLPAPRTAPRTVTRLYGRLDELARVLGAAEQQEGPAPVVAITGLGGMGKSALAVEAAHLLRDRFPDGTLYLDFDCETGRAGVSSVLSLFLGLLGVPGDAVPATHDARVALYRSVIDDRRILIVLDDVPGDLDVGDLLPARASSMALLTSRHSLAAVQPTVRVRLTGLADDDGAALLRDLLGPDRAGDAPADVAALARECRGLPILLRVTAQRVAGRPDLTLRKACSSLSAEIAGRPGSPRTTGGGAHSGEHSDEAVYAGLGLAEARLPAEARAVLGDVAHLPFARVSRWLVAALAGDEVAGDAVVDTLHAACLLDPVVQAGRTTQFQLHDLVRLYARRAAAEDQPAVAQRTDAHLATVVRHLLVLAEAHARVFPARLLPVPPPHLDPAAPCSLAPSTSGDPAGEVDPPSPEDALVFFRTEQDTILTCVRWATEHDPAAAWRLLALLAHHAQASVESGLWSAAAQTVHDLLPETTPDGRRGRAHLMLAESLIRHEASDSKYAAPLAVRARRTLHLEGDQLGAVAAAVVIGRCQRANGRRAPAEEALGWASATVDETTPPELHGYVELAWGSLLDDYDELRPARTHLLRALDHLEGTGDWAGLATAQFALARVHRRLGEYEAGLPRCDVAMELFARLGDVNGRTAVLDTRADLLVHMGEPAAALGAAREAVEQAGQRRDAFMLHRAQRTVGRALAGLGRLDDAEQALRDSVAGFEALVRPLSLAASLRDLGRVLQLVGRVDEARTIFLRERACLERAGLVDLSELDELISRLDARREGVRPATRRRRGRGA